MNVFIAFLRGINVGGQKKIKMAELKICLEDSGFQQVVTYIQSGNIVVQSNMDPIKVRSAIENAIRKVFGFEVPVLVTTADEIESILNKNPYLGIAEEKQLYFVLPYNTPKKAFVSNLDPQDYPHEEFHITDNCVYLNCKIGAGKAKLSNTIVERKLQLTATTRNLRTMQKMVQLARSIK